MGIKSNSSEESYYNYFDRSGVDAWEPAPTGYEATGGTKFTPGDGYIYHMFTSSGSLVVTTSPGASDVDYVLVGGGGGGAVSYTHLTLPTICSV